MNVTHADVNSIQICEIFLSAYENVTKYEQKQRKLTITIFIHICWKFAIYYR